MRELRRANEGSGMKDYYKKLGCKLTAWRGRLCYTHWRESQGQFFVPEQKLFVGRLKSRQRSHGRQRSL